LFYAVFTTSTGKLRFSIVYIFMKRTGVFFSIFVFTSTTVHLV
jgi:hypothetical protein